MTDRNTQVQEHKDRPVRGADLQANERPGVPMENAPRPLTPTAHWEEPQRMPPHQRGISHRKQLETMTHVYGTAQPLHGVSGLLRRAAYGISETKARHWMMLLLADRVDVWEHRIAKLVKVTALAPVGVALLVLTVRAFRR